MHGSLSDGGAVVSSALHSECHCIARNVVLSLESPEELRQNTHATQISRRRFFRRASLSLSVSSFFFCSYSTLPNITWSARAAKSLDEFSSHRNSNSCHIYTRKICVTLVKTM